MTLPEDVDPAEASQAREVDALACALHTVERRLTPAQRAAQFGLHSGLATMGKRYHVTGEGNVIRVRKMRTIGHH